MKLAVVILNWNQAEDTIACVRAVQAWPVLKPAIFVVDNASAGEDVRQVLAACPGARVVESRVNTGFAGGCNLGIVAALDEGAEAVLLLNNDARLDEAGMARLMDLLAGDAQIGIVGPGLWHGDQLLALGGLDLARSWITHARPDPLPSAPVDVAYVSGTAALIHRRLTNSVGLLDEAYFFSGEMADLCRRATDKGLRCVVDPAVKAQHDVGRSGPQRETIHTYYSLRNRFIFVRKRESAQRTRLLLLWTVRSLRTIMGALIHGDRRRVRVVWLALVHGLTGRTGDANRWLMIDD